MITNEQFEALRQCQFFSEVSGKALWGVLEALTVRHVDARQVIIRKGDPSEELYVLVFGQVTVFAAHGPKLLRLATLERPAALGEIGAIDGRERTATVVADTPLEMLAIDRHDLVRALDAEPIAWKGVAMSLAGLARGAAEKEDALLRDLRARLARLLLRLADTKTGAIPVTQREIAELLGAGRSAITPHLSYFRRQGILSDTVPMVILRRDALHAESSD